jgi:hypothetical protein
MVVIADGRNQLPDERTVSRQIAAAAQPSRGAAAWPTAAPSCESAGTMETKAVK